MLLITRSMDLWNICISSLCSLINYRFHLSRSSASSFSSQFLVPTPFTSVASWSRQFFFSQNMRNPIAFLRRRGYHRNNHSLSPFKENNNVVAIPFPFHIFMSLDNLWLISLQGQFPIPRQEVALNSIRSSALQEGRWHLVEENPYPGIHSVPSYITHSSLRIA